MSRLIPMALVCTVGFAVSPNAQAGGTPSAFDPVFSPVSYRAQYAPYETGYTSYYSGYTPYSTGYTPYYTGFAGFFGIPSYSSASYASGCGCQSCGGYSGCSSCGGGCASGNCASGNCATGGCGTTTNMTPGSPLSPSPDPAYQSKTIENRLDAVERKLNLKTGPTKTYEDGWGNRGNNNPGTNSTRGGNTGGRDDTNFVAPDNRNRGTTGTFSEDPVDSGVNGANKVPLAPPPNPPEEQVIPSKKAAPAKAPVDSTLNMQMDSRLTSRAISPRERHSTEGQTSAVVASRKRTGIKLEVDAGLRLDAGRY